MKANVASALLALTLPLGAGAALATVAPNGQEPAPGSNQSVDEITVIGERPQALRRQMMDFVFEIGDPLSRHRGFARWSNRVCVGVHDLADRETAQYFADRISLIALEVGLKVGEPGCRPNINIVFAEDGRELATRLVTSQPRVFRPFARAAGTSKGRAALEDFQGSDAPVRWWQVTVPVDEMGLPVINNPNDEVSPVVRGTNSRLRQSVTDDLWSSLVIVDVSKVRGKSLPQLADYLAMVSLAQIDPTGAPVNFDSILNLFGTAAPAGMSEMDRAYLRALYEMDNTTMPQDQRSMLVRQMVRNHTRDPVGK